MDSDGSTSNPSRPFGATGSMAFGVSAWLSLVSEWAAAGAGPDVDTDVVPVSHDVNSMAIANEADAPWWRRGDGREPCRMVESSRG